MYENDETEGRRRCFGARYVHDESVTVPATLSGTIGSASYRRRRPRALTQGTHSKHSAARELPLGANPTVVCSQSLKQKQTRQTNRILITSTDLPFKSCIMMPPFSYGYVRSKPIFGFIVIMAERGGEAGMCGHVVCQPQWLAAARVAVAAHRGFPLQVSSSQAKSQKTWEFVSINTCNRED